MKSLKKLTLRCLDWDTKQLGVRSGLIDATGLGGAFKASALSGRIKEICKEEKGARFITIKLPEDCPETVNSLIRLGACLIDTELVFSYSKEAALNNAKPAMDDLKFLFCRTYPAEQFIPLAKEMRLSRFFLDPKISKARALRLWEASIKNHCEGFADGLLVASYKKNPCGIVMLKFKNKKQLFLHVVGILKKFQGMRIAGFMLREIARRYSDSHSIFVETLSRNMPARIAYQKSGFSQDSVRYILHYWR